VRLPSVYGPPDAPDASEAPVPTRPAPAAKGSAPRRLQGEGAREGLSIDDAIEALVAAASRGRVALPEGTSTEAPERPARLSAVVACYRDAQAIPVMHKRLSDVFSSLAVDYEIIFVNDGSPDESDAVLRELTAKDHHVLAIEHSRNFGSQNAFLSGMELATGDAVVLLDGDLQDPPELIPAFYEKWRQGNDVVYGRRAGRDTSRLLGMSYKAFYRIFRGVSSVPMPLDAGDFSLMDRRVVHEILAFPESDQFLRGLRSWVGFKQAGVDYVRPARAFGRSNNNWLTNLRWAKKGIFSFSFVPLELLGYSGAGLTLLSLLGAGYETVAAIRHPQLPRGISAIVVLLLFLAGLNLLAISVLGEYLIKVFEETKRRPRFIRKAIRYRGALFDSAERIQVLANRRDRDAGNVSGRQSSAMNGDKTGLNVAS